MTNQHSSEFIKGIEFTIDTISSSLNNQALDVLPSKMVLKILIAGLRQDIEDLTNTVE